MFVSDTGPHDRVTGKIVGDTIQEQTRQCLKNVSAILKAAGTSLERVASFTVILLEEADFAGMNEVYSKYFTYDFPARSTIQVVALPKGANVEIEVIAHF